MTGTARSARVVVIGAGAISQVAHLPILSRMRGVELAGIFDTDRAKSRTLAERFGLERVYRSEEEVWRDEEVDAVVIATPSHLHEEQTRAGLQAGKFVLCEKPLAVSAEGTRRVLETEGSESRLMVGMNQRFRADAGSLRTFVAGNELGEVFYVRAGWLNRREGPSRRTWRQLKRGAGGGALMDLGIQMLDLCLWILDYPEPGRLTAHLHRRSGSEVEDSGSLLLELADGRVVNLEVSWDLLAERDRQYLHLLANAGSGTLAPLKVFKQLESGLLDVTPPIAPGRENMFTASYRQQLAFFTEAVRGRRQLRPPAEHVALMRIIDAAYRSAAEGKEIVF